MADNRELYVVRPQDTVYSIAWRYGLDFRDLARWNNIGSDFRITVGQTLSLAPSRSATPARSRAPTPARPPPSSPAPNRSAQPSAGATGLTWDWPTDRSGAPRPVPSGGVLLSGQLGQDVRAAAAGRVVYSGTGIRGYGNLIIIKHGENLLSAYAHNRESLVHDGQEIALGQLIGHMGEGAPGKPVLYFEIRRNGKPVDPLSFLPRVR
ncbi:MAG TPA: peptidoglycan DD-metalloendopeptidase family protein [Steroidobacteraceae bacterium]|jgi:lipoprotein NlpD|nr:peptidoglycan DD-metalloendopeptidase family protein [Steroidobacteraceae bacterium]